MNADLTAIKAALAEISDAELHALMRLLQGTADMGRSGSTTFYIPEPPPPPRFISIFCVCSSSWAAISAK